MDGSNSAARAATTTACTRCPAGLRLIHRTARHGPFEKLRRELHRTDPPRRGARPLGQPGPFPRRLLTHRGHGATHPAWLGRPPRAPVLAGIETRGENRDERRPVGPRAGADGAHPYGPRFVQRAAGRNCERWPTFVVAMIRSGAGIPKLSACAAISPSVSSSRGSAAGRPCVPAPTTWRRAEGRCRSSKEIGPAARPGRSPAGSFGR